MALSGLALFLQAAFFAHGGFSTWGANLVSLGFGGAFGGWLAFQLARRAGCPLWLAGAIGGLVGDVATYAIAGLSLAAALAHAPTPKFTFTGYLVAIYAAYLPIQGPIAIGEMLITGLALHYIEQQRPEILASLRVIGQKAVSATGMLLLAAGLTLHATAQPATVAAPPASAVNVASGQPAATDPTDTNGQAQPTGMRGMDEAVNEHMAVSAGRFPRSPYINMEAMGDVWNCALLLAGGICGFIVGRWWHLLFGRRKVPPRAGSKPSDREAT